MKDMSKSNLVKVLEQEGLEVVSEEVSPKGIIKVYLKHDHVVNVWAVFRKLGLSAKELPGNYTRYFQDKVQGYRLN